VRSLAGFVIAIVLLLAACERTASKPAVVGASAPGFTVADKDRNLSLEQFRGHVVVLNFWASWCPPCIEETPSLIALGQQAQRQGIVLLAVSEDESEQDYRRFVAEHNLAASMVVIRDARRAVAPRYGTFIFPETYVIDPAGVIRRKFIGAVDWTKPEILESLVRLQSQTPAPSRASK
jgi:cytochrome c biogenesis protein CcmG/thiol:disulfide interchange protein DsbE